MKRVQADSKYVLPNVSTLLFDFGQVLLGVDFARSERAFLELIGLASGSPKLTYSRDNQSELFVDFETGSIDDDAFRNGLRQQYGFDADDKAIDAAYNAALLEVFPGREELMRRLRPHFRLALLSNTNLIHHRYVQPYCERLLACFERVFFSYEMGLRKPDPAIYTATLEELDCAPSDILFIDDSPPNAESAARLGIHTVLLEEPDALGDLCKLLLQSRETAP